ncbi:MAG TPA: methyltransferase [Caulobacteraceae bacterium]|jgi:predicted methyltransferase
MDRRQFALAASALALTGAAPAAGVSPLLARIVAGPQRSSANKVRDPFRHPAQSLAFWGLAPGMTVVEIEPSGGYWTEILAPYLRATGGRYVAALGDEDAEFKARFSDPARWGKVEAVAFTPQSGPLVPNGTADLVLTARNFHNWMWRPGLVPKYLADFHAALKPHAILALEEHRADPRPMNDDAHDGYVSTAFLTRKVELAGFSLEAASEINANPKDTKDHPFGVWTLPPTRRTHTKGQPTPADFDPAKYEAIGESDRMTLRFRRV